MLVALCGSVRAQPSAAAFTVSGPAMLQLGQDAEATLDIKASTAQPRVFANVGTLGGLRRVGAERWQVTYHVPEQRYPQLAVIGVVSADGSQFGSTSIALYGSARVEIQSEPEVLVEVRVGQTSYGPTTTDRAGHAEVAVTVPPGVDSAISVATDALGNQKEQQIPLGVPPLPRVLAVCGANNGREVLAFVVDRRGLPARGAALIATAPDLRLERIAEVGPGVYRIAFAMNPQIRASAGQTHTFDIALKDEAESSYPCECTTLVEAPTSVPTQRPTPSESAPEPSALSAGLALGYVTNFAKVRGPSLALHARWRLPLGVELGLQAGYQGSHHSGRSDDGRETIVTKLSGWLALVRAAYVVPLRIPELWLFAGGGAMLVASEITGDLISSNKATSVAFAFAAGSGAALPLGPGRIALELSYTHAAIDAHAVTGNAAGLGASLGYLLDL